jgi:hypothetical protein
VLKKSSSHLVSHSPRVFWEISFFLIFFWFIKNVSLSVSLSSRTREKLISSSLTVLFRLALWEARKNSSSFNSIWILRSRSSKMSSFRILRLFLDSSFSKTKQSDSDHHLKSKKFSSSLSDRNKIRIESDRDKIRIESDRNKIRIIYNKIAYERDVVIILLIKIRTNLDISLFDRISFKDIAVAKVLYVCLSNIKKIQYKTQAEQIIRDFLDTKDVFNRSLSQFRAESAVNANLKLISQWSRTKQRTFYRFRFNSWLKERKTQNQNRSLSSSSREYHRESSSSSLKLDTRLFRSESSEKYRKESSKNEERSRFRSYRSDRQKRDCHRSEHDEFRSRTKSSDYYRFYRSDSEKRDYYRSDHDKSRLLSSRENRYLKENRTTKKYREKYRQELVKERSIYNSSKKFSKDSDFRNLRFFVFRSRSSWKNLVSTRSRYDNDSRYCIRLLYLSVNDLSENDLSEDDCDLFWISEILLFSSRYYQILEISRISAFFHLSSSLFIKNWFFSTRKAVVRPILFRKNQNRSKSITSTYFY